MAQGAAVLVVEDDEDVRQATVTFLSSAGYACLEAANGREALDRLPDLARPAVVILDVMMPVMDGLDFLQEVGRRGQLSRLSVVIVTASPSICEGRTVADGFPVVQKPIAAGRLLELVQTRVATPADAGE
jgi:CheY-like chemotaxis protein